MRGSRGADIALSYYANIGIGTPPPRGKIFVITGKFVMFRIWAAAKHPFALHIHVFALHGAK